MTEVRTFFKGDPKPAKARKPLRRRTPMRGARAAFTRRGKPKPLWWKIRRDVESRAGGRCEVRADGCTIRGEHAHHRLMRSQGGPDDAGNLLWVCPSCHHYVHAHPTESYERGWLIRGVS